MKAKYQRDINRLVDADKGSRKRGLQRLLDELPWSTHVESERDELVSLVKGIMPMLLPLINDAVEKCRESTLDIITKAVEQNMLSPDEASSIILAVCARLNDTPFPEPTEEIRIMCLRLITHMCSTLALPLNALHHKTILHMLPYALSDSFPVVKSEASMLLCLVPLDLVRMNYKAVLKPLLGNIFHQHSKVRVVTLKALGAVLAAVTEDYTTLVHEQLQPLLLRLVTDHSFQVRAAVASMCESSLVAHAASTDPAQVSACTELTAVLLILLADDSSEVILAAEMALQAAAVSSRHVTSSAMSGLLPHEGDDVEDAEVSLAGLSKLSHTTSDASTQHDSKGDSATVKSMLVRHRAELDKVFISGVGGWTSMSRLMYLKGLRRLVHILEADVTPMLPTLLLHVASCLLDDDAATRLAAESVCCSMGLFITCAAAVDHVLVYANGSLSGHDTSSSRSMGLRAMTHVLAGLTLSTLQEDTIKQRELSALAQVVAHTVSDVSTHAFREPVMRESVLLLVRQLVELLAPDQVLVNSPSKDVVEGRVTAALVCLMGRVAGDADSLVQEMSLRELSKLAAMRGYRDRGSLVDAHFEAILNAFPLTETQTWDSSSVAKSVFEVLVREGTASAWRLHSVVVPIVVRLAQPRARLVHGSPEEHAASYASMRGEDTQSMTADVELRLQMLALLEDLIRKGSQGWESGVYITAASEGIIRDVVLPNLVWRAGRVEATMRKVSLAACYGILKAGATSTDTLSSVAPSLVPLLTSALDDTYSDVTPRYMACICLTVIFDRLSGKFGEQSVREVYPLLLKKLDDSADSVRVAICSTLTSFFKCAPPIDFRGTVIDYSLDQLFIHLDDANKDIQEAVLKVIVDGAAKVDAELVLKKAASNKLSHRSPHLCDAIIAAVTG